MDWKANEAILRFMGLFSVRIGLRDGENEIENKMTFIAVAVRVGPNGRIVAEYGNSVGERVEVDVNETGTEKSDCCVNVGDGDGDDSGRGDAIGDCGEQGELHGRDDR